MRSYVIITYEGSGKKLTKWISGGIARGVYVAVYIYKSVYLWVERFTQPPSTRDSPYEHVTIFAIR